MRWLSGICALFIGMSVSGCALIEAEKDNRGGFLDQAADRLWMKADSKKMRALRAVAIEASLARIAMIAPKSAPDRALLARRIGETSKRADVVRKCAFLQTTSLIRGQRPDEPCFFFDSVMVDYENALFDLALVALPIEDAKNLITRVSGGIASISVNPMELIQTLVDLGREAFRYGRVVGAIYRDTMELEVQVWLASPQFANDERARGMPEEFVVTNDRVAGLRAAYVRGNDNIPAWRAEIAALRAEGLEPVPHSRFILEVYSILTYICGQIVNEKDPAFAECTQPALITNFPVVSDVSLFGPIMRGAGPGVIRPDRAIRTDRPPPPQPSVNNALLGAISELEKKSVSLQDGKDFQNTLCIAAPGDFGPINSPTRMALRQFYAAYTLKDDAPASINTLVDLQRLRTARNMFPSCQEAGFLSGFEVGIYTSVGANEMRARLGRALRAAQITAPQGLNTPPAVGKAIDQPVRDAIALLRTSYALAGQPEFDLAFYNRMMMSLVR